MTRKAVDGLVTFAVLSLVMMGTLPTCHRGTTTAAHPLGPIARLARAAPRIGRRVEARFSGDFRWAPLRGTSRRPLDEGELEGVAGQILAESERTRSVATLHAAGVARALLGSFGESVSRLEGVCRLTPRDAEVWNDLAAARYAYAVDRDDPERLPAALSAADHALRLVSSLAPARFNRALILTHLGMRNEALRAWTAARSAERDPAWAAEADSHASELRKSAASPVDPKLERALDLDEQGASKGLRLVVRDYPQEARTFAEATLLTSWAEAEARGDASHASRSLKRTHRIGELLAGVNSDWLVADLARTISGASPRRRHRIAEAHLAYHDARFHDGKGMKNSASELRRAAELFAHARTPMEHVARAHEANALFVSNRVEESRAELLRVLASIDSRRYPFLAGGVEKELGLYYGFRGMWTASLERLERSRTLFSRHGERTNAAFTEAVTGEAYDRIGDFDRGWRHRIAAMDVLSHSAPDARSLPVLIGAAHAEIMRADYESALSLLQVAREESEQVAIPDIRAEMVLREARVFLIARGEREAEQVLVNARRIADSIENDGTRGRIEAEIAVIEAATTRRTEPSHAVKAATSAIAFFQSHELGILLPTAYLERGRAHLALDERAEARSDFTAGLDWIERQRANVAASIRATLFDTVPDLTGELIDLLLKDGDEDGAYAVVERARARTLIEALGIETIPGSLSVQSISAALPKDAMIVEYALLPDQAAAFCIGTNGLTVRRLSVKRPELLLAVRQLRDLIENRKPIAEVQRAAALLYDDLYRPLDEMLAGVNTIYVVPDRFLHATAFPALYDSREGRYLVEKHRLILAPSGAFLLRRARLRRRLRPMLIVADPTSSGGGKRLDAARSAAGRIARLFSAPPPLIGPNATRERFVAAAPNSAFISYAGHAHSDDTAGGFLPLARSGDTDGRLDATRISSLRLQRTTLVVLSGCSTMRGDVSRIEGMPSLSRAFLTAGAQSVVGMLWDIDDATTARLLTPFYRRLRARTSPSQALREAQIEMLHSDREALRHPASWAAAEFLGVD